MLTMRSRRWGVLLSLVYVMGCDRDQPLGPSGLPSFRATETPSAITAEAVSPTQIDLSWTDQSSNESGFEVHWSTTGSAGAFTHKATTGANVTTHSDGGLAYGTAYCYKVRAFRTTGRKTTVSAFSTVACATTFPPPVPATPSGTNATPQNSRQVLVTWVDNAWDENGYRVQSSVDQGTTWTTVSWDLPPGTQSYHATVTADQVTCFHVMAFNGVGNSLPSNVDCTAAPLAPTQLTGAGVTGPAVELAWQGPSNVEDGYRVERAGPGSVPATVIATLPPDATAYRDAGVSADSRYTYYVRATRDGGLSDVSWVSVITASAVPPTPSNFHASPNGSTAVGMSWAYQPTNEDGFRIERSTDGGASWPRIGSVPFNHNTFTDGGVTPDQAVCYRVKGYNGAGESQPSQHVCTAPPAAPTNLTATAVEGAFAIDLAWTDNSSVEDGYEVWRLFTQCNYYYYYNYGCYSYWSPISPTLPASSRSFTDETVNPFEVHYYVVVAKKGGGSSTTSNEAYAAASGPPQ